MSDTEWAARSKTRAAEILAVSEVITMLADDDAHDLTGRTLSFVDVGAARKVLAKMGMANALGQSARSDVFAKVLAQIDTMVVELKQEQEDEVKHRDWCTGELHTSDMDQMANKNRAEDIASHIDVLEAKIEQLNTDAAALKQEINNMLIQTQRANEDRQAENKQYQDTIADARATQALLKKALERLQKFYGSLLQRAEPGAAAPPAPKGFSEYKANSGAGSVMTMIGNVITDAKEMEQEAAKGEQDAQVEYERFIRNSNSVVKAAQRAVVAKQEERAKAEEEVANAQADAADAEAERATLAAAAADIHTSCDFVLANFDARQEQRSAEMEGLENAIAAIKGGAVF